MIRYIILWFALTSTAHSHEWDYDAWVIKTATIDNKIGSCFILLRDNDLETFKQTCDIHTLAVQHYTAIEEFHREKFIAHPIMSDVEYVLEHMPPVLGPMVARNFYESVRVDVAIMTIYLADLIYVSDK